MAPSTVHFCFRIARVQRARIGGFIAVTLVNHLSPTATFDLHGKQRSLPKGNCED